MKLIEGDRIWGIERNSGVRHCAFGDLTLYRGVLLAVFREADGHVSDVARIRVLFQNQRGRWMSLGTIGVSDRDLRDPHFWHLADGTLCITAAVVDRSRNTAQSATYAWPLHQLTLGEISGYGTGSLLPDRDLSVTPHVLTDHNCWLWRVLGTSSENFGFCYGNGELYFCRSSFTNPFAMASSANVEFDNEKVNEAALCLSSSGSLIALLRCDPDRWRSNTEEFDEVELSDQDAGHSALSYFGVSQAPYSHWAWQPFPQRVGGPSIIPASDGGYWAAFRAYRDPHCWEPQWVEVVKLGENGETEQALRLPSGGSDCGYPGLVEQDGELLCLYYSNHESDHGASIYLARIAV